MLMQTQFSSRVTFPLSPTSNLSEFRSMLTPFRDAIHVANPNAQFRCGANPVRFVVNGYALETTEATIRYVPGTYLTWLLDNCREDVINGRPIQLKTSPKTFCNLIRRLRRVLVATSEFKVLHGLVISESIESRHGVLKKRLLKGNVGRRDDGKQWSRDRFSTS